MCREGAREAGEWREQRTPNLQIRMVDPSFLVPKLNQSQCFGPQPPPQCPDFPFSLLPREGKHALFGSTGF